MNQDNPSPKKMVEGNWTNFSEGMIKKGGVNLIPTIPRPPEPPKGATPQQPKATTQPQPTPPQENKK